MPFAGQIEAAEAANQMPGFGGGAMMGGSSTLSRHKSRLETGGLVGTRL